MVFSIAKPEGWGQAPNAAMLRNFRPSNREIFYTGISRETPIANPRPGGDKAPAHGDLALLRRMHRGDSRCCRPRSFSMGSRPDWAGTGRVRDPRGEPAPLPVDRSGRPLHRGAHG